MNKMHTEDICNMMLCEIEYIERIELKCISLGDLRFHLWVKKRIATICPGTLHRFIGTDTSDAIGNYVYIHIYKRYSTEFIYLAECEVRLARLSSG